MANDNELSDPEDAQQIRDLDSRSLRGVAHSMRVRILNALALDGPSTATRLADELGVRSGSTSWHLQKLAEHGFIEEVPELGTPRERWWRALTPKCSVDIGAYVSPEGQLAEATAALLSSLIAQHMAATQFLYGSWSRKWREAFILITENTLRLTPEQLTDLQGDLVEVLRRYREYDAESDNAELIQFQLQGFPYRAGLESSQ